MTKIHATRRLGPATWTRTTLTKNYEDLGIAALHAALVCKNFRSPAHADHKVPTWHGAPNMSGILAGVAES
ncbi:hypothetical protein [Roseibium sp.]|uniref:hypothetical protein n=1 Tax=Roseibium sp. TaxID=1936156 RepID=UPI003B5085EA